MSCNDELRRHHRKEWRRLFFVICMYAHIETYSIRKSLWDRCETAYSSLHPLPLTTPLFISHSLSLSHPSPHPLSTPPLSLPTLSLATPLSRSLPLYFFPSTLSLSLSLSLSFSLCVSLSPL